MNSLSLNADKRSKPQRGRVLFVLCGGSDRLWRLHRRVVVGLRCLSLLAVLHLYRRLPSTVSGQGQQLFNRSATVATPATSPEVQACRRRHFFRVHTRRKTVAIAPDQAVWLARNNVCGVPPRQPKPVVFHHRYADMPMI